MPTTETDAATVEAVARAFVNARQSATALPDFPGTVPADLATAYATQDAAITQWPDRVAGWKIGRVPPEHAERLNALRLAGPVFARSVWLATPGEPTVFPVFEGGFAAVEAEYVFRLAKDAPANKTSYSEEEAAELVAALHVGIETAGSPLATINKLGPTVVVSDFGNNAGLIVGPTIEDWRERPLKSLTCETFIDGQSVGRGSAASLLGGPLASLAFVLGNSAARGRPLKAGDFITTGAVTGIHDILAGQRAHVLFDSIGTIACVATKAKPLA